MGHQTLDKMFDKLTRKAQEANPRITRQMLEEWVGNDGYASTQRDWMMKTLEELETGEYTAEELAEDVLQLQQG